MKFDANRTAFFQSIAPGYKEDWKPINRSQADVLFKENAYYFGSGMGKKVGMVSGDGVPIVEACKLFGWQPVAQTLEADRADNGPRWLFYDLTLHTDSCFEYLTWAGFMHAVIICNAKAFEEQNKPFSEAWRKDIEEADRAELEAAALEAGKPKKRGRKPKNQEERNDGRN